MTTNGLVPVAILEINLRAVTVDVAFRLAPLTLPVNVTELLAVLKVKPELPARIPLLLYCTVVVTPPAAPPPPPPEPPVNDVSIPVLAVAVKQAQLAAREAYEEKVLVRKEEIEIAALRKKGLNDAADDLLNQQKRRQEFLTLGYTLDKELGAMLAKVIRTEAFDSTTTGLSNVGVEAGKLATDLKNAKTSEEVKELFNRVAETITNGTDRNVQDLNASVQLSGEALGKKLGIFTFVFDTAVMPA